MAAAKVVKLLAIFLWGQLARHVFCCVGSIDGRPSAPLHENGVK